MKNILLVLFIVVLLVGGIYADSVDTRSNYQNQGTPVFRIQVPQLVVASDSAASTTSNRLNLNGRIKQIVIEIGNISASTVTAQIQLIDSSDPRTIFFDVTAIAAGTTLFNSQFHTGSTTTASTTAIPMNILMAGSFTVVITPSGPPGSSTLEVDVDIWGD